MANNLSYQQARKIRKTGFTDLFVDQLAQKNTGVFGAVGKTLSLRTSARIKGYKEKFDPLNIAKFLTFGSKLGPALYGKIMGRSQKDIDYFTNRTRAIKGGNNTADRIGPSPDTGMQGINEQLAKIYQFLKSTREDDTRHAELMSNTEEEQNTEKQRRHRELMETLKKLVGNLGGTTQIVSTPTAEPQTNYYGILMKMIKGLQDAVASILKQLLDLWNSIRILDKLRKILPWLTRFAANPALIIPFLIGGGIYLAFNNIEENKAKIKKAAEEGNVEDLKKYLRAGLGDEAFMYAGEQDLVEAELRRANTPKALEALDRISTEGPTRTRKQLYQQGLAEQGFFPRGDTFRNFRGEEPNIEQKRKAEEYQKRKFQEQTDRISSTLPRNPNPYIPPFMPGAMTFEEQDVTPPPVDIGQLSQNNQELNYPIASSNFGPDTQMAKATTVNNLNSPTQNKGLNPSQIAVRNPENTYRNLIEQSVAA